ncbi:hypothetical protein ACHWQZ_G011569 [Mnemiopsis leidyi]
MSELEQWNIKLSVVENYVILSFFSQAHTESIWVILSHLFRGIKLTLTGLDTYFLTCFEKFVQVTHSRNVSTFFGDYSLYHCTLHTIGGKVISNEKRYSDFVSLRESLVKSFAFPPSALPDFPQKKVIGKFKEDFISQRRQGLEDFLNSVYFKYSQEVNSFIEMWLTSCKN